MSNNSTNNNSATERQQSLVQPPPHNEDDTRRGIGRFQNLHGDLIVNRANAEEFLMRLMEMYSFISQAFQNDEIAMVRVNFPNLIEAFDNAPTATTTPPRRSAPDQPLPPPTPPMHRQLFESDVFATQRNLSPDIEDAEIPSPHHLPSPLPAPTPPRRSAPNQPPGALPPTPPMQSQTSESNRPVQRPLVRSPRQQRHVAAQRLRAALSHRSIPDTPPPPASTPPSLSHRSIPDEPPPVSTPPTLGIAADHFPMDDWLFYGQTEFNTLCTQWYEQNSSCLSFVMGFLFHCNWISERTVEAVKTFIKDRYIPSFVPGTSIVYRKQSKDGSSVALVDAEIVSNHHPETSGYLTITFQDDDGLTRMALTSVKRIQH